jgi:hypothetical protein
MSLDLQMQVSSLAYGKRCHGCRQVGKLTAFQVWRGDHLLKNVQLCSSCVEQGVAADLTVVEEKPFNPLSAKAGRRQIKRSRDMEANLAEQMGGKAQPASGSSRLSGFKGDVRKMGSWRVEHKFTDATKTWTLKLSDLAKIVSLAMDANEYPALVIEFTKAHESFAIIPLTLFLEIANEDDEHPAPARRRRKGR